MQKYYNLSNFIGYLYTFCGNHNFVEDLFNRYSIQLWVIAENIKVTNICICQKLLSLFVLLIVELTQITFCWLKFFCFDLDEVEMIQRTSAWLLMFQIGFTILHREQHSGFDVSFWSTVVKIYPFTTLKWVNKYENIYGRPTIFPAHRPIYFSNYWKKLLSEITVPQAKPGSNCLNSTILAIE